MKRIVINLFVLAALALPAGPACRAGLVISYEGLQVDSGGSGTFEVVIANTEGPGGASYDISAFLYEIRAAAGTGMTFTDATIAGLTHPYVFAGVGQAAASGDPAFIPSGYYGVPFVLATYVTSDDILISDGVFYVPLFVTIAPGETYSLGLISFTSTPGLSPGDLAPLADPTGGSLAPASVVPEPSSLAMLGLAGAMLLVLRRRRTPGRLTGLRLAGS